MKPEGYILLHKQSGITSFQALTNVKKAFSTGKVGHTGTLDKFASGLLFVLVGRAVKLSPWFLGGDKWYEGIIRFGIETDTLDPEGLPVAEGEIPTRESLEKILPEFRGHILQQPPEYSAIHLEGKRASRLARQGLKVELPRRPVSIYTLELNAYKAPFAHITVHCSKGTYIRSLARDIARAAGSRGHLVSLNRTQIAGFQDADALKVQEGDAVSVLMEGALRPIDQYAFKTLGLPCLVVDAGIASKMLQGKPLASLIKEESFMSCDNLKSLLHSPANVETSNALVFGVFNSQGDFVAVIEKEAHWRYGYVYGGV